MTTGPTTARAISPGGSTQKPRQPAQEEAEVVASRGEHGIDPIALAPLQIIAAHTVLGLGMADDWFDGGSPPHLAANGFGNAPNLAADPDAGLHLCDCGRDNPCRHGCGGSQCRSAVPAR